MARLHMICGNCGCNDSFKYKITKEYDEWNKEEHDRVSIICENCGTIHDLSDNAEKDLKK